jgi:prevent-host-death family protein
MIQVTVHEAKTHLSRLIDQVLQGEEVIIAKRNHPVVRLVQEESETRGNSIGSLRGLILRETEDCWDPDDDYPSPTDPLD